MPGRFFVFEGIDGCGKTTQARLLELELRRRGRPVVGLREPGGTPVGERVRDLLLEARCAMEPWTEVFLFMASRAQLIAERLEPALGRGKTVILDRYYYSTAAYQGAAGGVGIPVILNLAERVARFRRPDRVFVLDVDPAVARRRRSRPADRMERKGLDYQRAVRRGFLDIARRERRRFRVLPGDQPPTIIHEKILEEVDRAL